MSGHIGISLCSGVATNSQSFDHIVDAIRPKLKAIDEKVFNIVYSSYDAGIISAASLNMLEFKYFSRSVIEAYNEKLVEGSFSEDDRRNWNEIILKINADNRFVGSLEN